MILLEDYLIVGKNAVVRKIVQKSDSTGNYSLGLNELLSTPSCVDMVIRAAVEAVDKHLPQEYVTVGRTINFSHDHATIVGMTVNVKATLTEIQGKNLYFKIEAWDELGDIGHGSHERVVVRKAEVIAKAKERAKYLEQRTF
jgi:fluoroacetyl-CoA thioesterase